MYHLKLHCNATNPNHQTIIHRQAYPDAATNPFSYTGIRIESVRALKKDKTMVAR